MKFKTVNLSALNHCLISILLTSCGSGHIKVSGMNIKAMQKQASEATLLSDVCNVIRQQGLSCRVSQDTAKFSGSYRYGILLTPMSGKVDVRNTIPGHFRLKPYFDDSRSVGAQGAQSSMWNETIRQISTEYKIIDNDEYKLTANNYAVAQKQANTEKRMLAIQSHIDGGNSWSKYLGFLTAGDASALCEQQSMRLPSKEELLKLYKSKADWINLGCYGSLKCSYWTNEKDDINMNYAMDMKSGKPVTYTADDKNDARCVEMSKAEQAHFKNKQVEKLTLSSKSILRYKFGHILKQKILLKMKSDYKRQGFSGQRLATRMQGAQMGVEMGFKQYGITLDLKENGYLIHSNGSETKTLKYIIKSNSLFIINSKTGKSGKLGVFSNNKQLFQYLGGTRFGSNVTMERY